MSDITLYKFTTKKLPAGLKSRIGSEDFLMKEYGKRHFNDLLGSGALEIYSPSADKPDISQLQEAIKLNPQDEGLSAALRDREREHEKVIVAIKNEIQDLETQEILKNPSILKIIDAELAKKIVGEEENRQAVFLIACGVYVKNHAVASFNLNVNSESGAGKDFLVRSVLDIFPKEKIESRTRISPTAFTYWHNAKFEPEWDWTGKICYLQDVSNQVLNHEVFKVMASEGSIATIVIEHKAVDITIKGKPVLLITAANANPNNEQLRRFPIITLDETAMQTREIMRRKAQQNKKAIEYDGKITQALKFLERVSVSIPFAEKLAEAFPDSHIIMRTNFDRLLDLVRASAALHQYQRERDSGGLIIATEQDYENARIAICQIASNAAMIPLTKRQKDLLQLIQEKFPQQPFCVADLLPFVSSGERALRKLLVKLKGHGFFIETLERQEGSDKPVTHFVLKQAINFVTPRWEDVEKSSVGSKGSLGSLGSVGSKGSLALENVAKKGSITFSDKSGKSYMKKVAIELNDPNEHRNCAQKKPKEEVVFDA